MKRSEEKRREEKRVTSNLPTLFSTASQLRTLRSQTLDWGLKVMSSVSQLPPPNSSSSIPLLLGIVDVDVDVPTVKVKLLSCGWRRFLNGISNQYDDTYPEQLQDVISIDDFTRILKSLHNRIASKKSHL